MWKFGLSVLFLSISSLGGFQRIINGTVVTDSDPIYWSTVRLIQFSPQGFWVPNCTAVVIDRGLILTAAHCVERINQSALRIAYEAQPFSFEQQYLETTRIDPTKVFETREIDDIEMHPNYSVDKIGNDLVIIKIKGDHPANFQPIPIIPQNMGNKLINNKRYQFNIAGYGLFAANPAVESAELRKANVSGRLGDRLIEMLQGDGVGGCFGDSGGPAVIKIGPTSYLIGITHGSKNKSANCDDTGLWVNLINQQSFILNSIKKLK